MVGSVAPPLPTSIKNKRKKESCWLVGRAGARSQPQQLFLSINYILFHEGLACELPATHEPQLPTHLNHHDAGHLPDHLLLIGLGRNQPGLKQRLIPQS